MASEKRSLARLVFFLTSQIWRQEVCLSPTTGSWCNEKITHIWDSWKMWGSEMIKRLSPCFWLCSDTWEELGSKSTELKAFSKTRSYLLGTRDEVKLAPSCTPCPVVHRRTHTWGRRSEHTAGPACGVGRGALGAAVGLWETTVRALTIYGPKSILIAAILHRFHLPPEKPRWRSAPGADAQTGLRGKAVRTCRAPPPSALLHIPTGTAVCAGNGGRDPAGTQLLGHQDFKPGSRPSAGWAVYSRFWAGALGAAARGGVRAPRVVPHCGEACGREELCYSGWVRDPHQGQRHCTGSPCGTSPGAPSTELCRRSLGQKQLSTCTRLCSR